VKLVSYQLNGKTTIGAVREEQFIVPLTAVASDMLSLIKNGEAGLEKARIYLVKNSATIPLKNVRLLAPLPIPPRNIMCLGKNYAEHAAESQRAWGEKSERPEFPMIFNKATTSINGPYSDIPYDASISTAIDFEAELAVIIGRSGKNISREKAMDYVFGYTVMNDITARDMQRRHRQFFKGKSLDGHAPMGPWIVTADDIPDPHNLCVTCHVNDILKQDDITSKMIFDIPETIAQLSLGMTLLPGDLIATGTPSGVGFARTPPEYLKPGDVVTCTVEGIGSIRNRIGAQQGGQIT
jgi:2-keto-4-pentenoate hydratase/2-oxohepta-3-ene-1,7-dioic acid hydratase in catechol pathway